MRRNPAWISALLLSFTLALSAGAAEEDGEPAQGSAAPGVESDAADEGAEDAQEPDAESADETPSDDADPETIGGEAIDEGYVPPPELTYEEPVTPGVDQITVTAERREGLIQDVPISMVALDSKFLEATGLTQFGRLQEFVPNLRITPVTDSRSTAIRIRGIGSTGTNAGVDPSVGVFIDGVYQGRAGMSVSDFLDVERVEVLRGPQGTLWGKNTAAGAISILSRRPSFEFEAMTEAVFGDEGQYETRSSVNIPVIPEKVAARLSGYWVTQSGFDHNRFDDTNVNENHRWGLKGRFLFNISDDVSFLLSGDYATINSDCCYPDIISYSGPPTLPLPGLGVTFPILAGARPPGSDFATLPHVNPFDRNVGANRKTRDKVKVGGAAGELEAQVGDFDLTWLLAWRHYQTDSKFDGDFSVYDAVFAGTRAHLNQVSSEMRAATTIGELFDIQTGLYLYYQQQDTTDLNTLQSEYIAQAVAIRAANLLSGNPLLQPLENEGENKHKTYTAAGFADGTFNISEMFSVTGGIRTTFEYKSRRGTQTSTAPGVVDAPPLLGPNATKNQDRDKLNVSGRAVLRFFPMEDVMTYASFSTGYKSGGFNQLRTTDGVKSEFRDETSLNYEVGFRSTWFDKRITLNVSGFYTDYDDFQALSFDGSSISIRNADALQSYGVEGELITAPLPGLVIGSLLGYNVAEFDHFSKGECTVGQNFAVQQASANQNAPDPCFQDLSGKGLDNAPEWTVSSFFQYDLPFEVPGYPLVWYTRADHNYTSSFFLAQDRDRNLKERAYNLVDLRMGLRAEDGGWDASLWVRNLLDEGFNIVGFDVPAMNGYAGVNAPPRQFGGTIRLRF